MNISVVSIFEDFKFPLCEAQRKQLWWLAKHLALRGHSVRAICFCKSCKKAEKFCRENVEIVKVPKNRIWAYRIKTEIIHYVGPLGVRTVAMLLLSKYRRAFVTIPEGNVLGSYCKSSFALITKIIKARISKIFIFTDFQSAILQKYIRPDRIQKIAPYFEFEKKDATRSDKPRLLFMSHLSAFKGINEVIDAFVKLKEKYPDLELIIADSGVMKSDSKSREAARLPGVVWKKVVDPATELAKAWIYLYPIKTVRGTMAIPLSLLESAYCDTPFISTAIGAIPEYFPEKYLLDKVTVGNLVESIDALLKSGFSKGPKKAFFNKGNVRINNNETTDIIQTNYLRSREINVQQ